jgi:protein SCO1/2
MKRRTLLILTIAIGTAIGAPWLADRNPHDWAHAPPALQGLMSPLPRTVSNFDLLTQGSQPFGREQLLGHWSLLYFGYLQCPDICPTTLQSMHAMQKLLAQAPDSAGAPEQFLFVSVDPGNDTPERIGPYLAFFGDGILGLSGDPQQLASLAGSVGVMYAEHIADDGTRSMDHSTSIIVVNPQGQAVAALPGPHQPVEMARQYRELRAWLE